MHHPLNMFFAKRLLISATIGFVIFLLPSVTNAATFKFIASKVYFSGGKYTLTIRDTDPVTTNNASLESFKTSFELILFDRFGLSAGFRNFDVDYELTYNSVKYLPSVSANILLLSFKTYLFPTAHGGNTMNYYFAVDYIQMNNNFKQPDIVLNDGSTLSVSSKISSFGTGIAIGAEILFSVAGIRFHYGSYNAKNSRILADNIKIGYLMSSSILEIGVFVII